MSFYVTVSPMFPVLQVWEAETILKNLKLHLNSRGIIK